MGLDMFLTYRKPIQTTLGAHQGPTGVANPGFNIVSLISDPHGRFAIRDPLVARLTEEVLGTVLPISDWGILYVEFPAAYWRKANAIHRWFVTNCQDDVDECQTVDVGLTQLEDLVALCQKVLDNPDEADDLLPAEGGFFFGSTDYDEWYLGTIRNTIEMLEPWIAYAKDRGQVDGFLSAGYFQYGSSW